MPCTIRVQSGRAHDTPYPISQTKKPRVCAIAARHSPSARPTRRRLATGIVSASTHHTCGHIRRTHTQFRTSRPPSRAHIRAGTRFPGKMPHATGGITRRATWGMGRKRVHESAGDATQRQRAVRREKLARRAEQSAQNGGDDCELFRLGPLYQYTNSACFQRQTD
jgi:hypothetical protein